MNPELRQGLIAFLDDAITRIEGAQTEEETRQALQATAEGFTDWAEHLPLVGPLAEHLHPERFQPSALPEPETVKAQLLPQLRAYRDALESGRPGGAPQNVPTRPGCFGGTGAILLALVLLFAALVR